MHCEAVKLGILK